MAKTLVGEVAHFFGKINVAALKLSGDLKVGDKIAIEHKDGSVVLEQTIDSMQIEHKSVNEAKAGDDVAIKTAEKVHAGNLVYKVTEE
jgi:translation initiation factor IF-2